MKAKKVVPQKAEQLKPLPASFNREEESLLPYQKEARDLAEVRIRNQRVESAAHFDALFWMYHRAIALCNLVEEMAASESPNETPKEHLVMVMGMICEDLEVSKWIARKMHDEYQNRLRLASSGAA